MECSIWHKGQSLIEVLIGIGLAAVFVIGAVSIIAPSLNTNTQVTQIQVESQLTNQLTQNVNSWGANWQNVVSTTVGTSYYLNTSSSPFTAVAGAESVVVNGTPYSRYFSINNVYRDSNGNVTTTASGNNADPSTVQVTVALGGPILASNAKSASSTYPFRQTPDNGSTCWVDFTALNGYLYGMGGVWNGANCGATPTTTTYFAQANGGAITSWTKTASIPASQGLTYGFTQATPYNGYLYITVGNQFPNSVTSTIFYAKPNSDGSISSWQIAGTLPTAEAAGELMATNGYFYFLGGFPNSVDLDYAKINNDGTFGTFTNVINTIPDGWSNNAGTAYNGYLYSPDQGSSPHNTNVYYTSVSATGTPAAWKQTTSLPVLTFVIFRAYGGYVYAFEANTPNDRMWYAPINGDGSLGSWTSGGSFPSSGGNGYSNEDFAISNGNLYFIGVGTTPTVYYAPSVQLASSTFLITRNQNSVVNQTSWAGGGNVNGPLTFISNTFATSSWSNSGSNGTARYVQGALGFTATSASTTATFTAAPTAGDLIAVGVSTYATNISSVTDSAGNTYSLAASAASSSIGLSIYYAQNIVTTSTFSVKANLTGGNEASIAAADISGVATSSVLDQAQAQYGVSTTPSTPSVTIGSAPEYIFTVEADNEKPIPIPTNLNLRLAQPDNATYQDLVFADTIATTTGSVSGTFTITNVAPTTYIAAIATFKMTSATTLSNDLNYSTPGSLKLSL